MSTQLPQKKCFEIQWVRNSSDTLVFEGKSNSKWWLTFLRTPNPSIVCALEGSQLCHLAVWSIEGTDLILSPLTQHDMQKITWAIANADVKSGKPYVCGFIDRSKKDKQGKSPTMSFNTDENEAGILLFWKSCDVYKIILRLYRYKCTKIVTKPLSFRKRHLARQNVYPCRKLERTPCLATWAAHAAVKFGQADSSKRRIWECRGPSIQTTFHMALREDTLHVFRIFKERIKFFEYICCLSNLSCTASDSTSPSDLPSEAVVQIGGSGRSWKTIARHALQELLLEMVPKLNPVILE